MRVCVVSGCGFRRGILLICLFVGGGGRCCCVCFPLSSNKQSSKLRRIGIRSQKKSRSKSTYRLFKLFFFWGGGGEVS